MPNTYVLTNHKGAAFAAPLFSVLSCIYNMEIYYSAKSCVCEYKKGSVCRIVANKSNNPCSNLPIAPTTALFECYRIQMAVLQINFESDLFSL